MRVEKKDKEFVRDAGLAMLESYFREKVFLELAMDGALVPKATAPFADAANARVRQLMRDLEELVNQYKRQPPTGPLGPGRRRP